MDKMSDKVFIGQQAEILKDNPAFQEAIRRMYDKLYDEEDKLVGRAASDEKIARDLGVMVKHIVMMRKTITDFVNELDGLMLSSKNAKYRNK